MGIDKRIEEAISREVADALNENDVELITKIKMFKAQNKFHSEEGQSAFYFACDEIIKLIESEE